ncbi:serine/threonine-protein kinase [Lentzea aerocolonigenes]|uniref:serine/threonine-protein kinase n=1 Tax=Lentzea aerocolonigenes TaxID=68170 RepID=UPI000697F120|nr:serine/threonine-protein kinase [Lentzea aerocolonigenes]
MIAGRYRTIRELGRGGMGVVWLAEDQVIGRRVALKELRTSETERVLSEARTAGRLNSPNVVAIHDVITDNGVTYIVMELVEAPTLTDLMARRTFTEDEVASIGLQTLSALEAAHAAGIVHRDVKPSNIMVAPDGTVKLTDFGIARAMDDPGLTATGGIMGSPGYMAPELFAGKAPSPASDLWALGATMFHAIEGHSPFQRDTTAATMHAIMYDEPVLRRARGPLATVIMGLLHQNPAQRLTAAQTRAQLGSPSERTVVIEPVTTFVAPTREEFPEPKRTGLIAGAAVAAVVVIALVTFLIVRPNDEPVTPAAQQVTTTATPPGETSSSAPSSSSAAPSSSQTPSSTPKSTQAQAQPQPTSAPQKPKRKTLALNRWNDGKWYFTASPIIAKPSQFTAKDGPAGWIAESEEAGTRKLYACKIGTAGDYMTAVNRDCDGHEFAGELGWIFTTQPADAESRVLYRCTRDSGSRHFDSLDGDCEGEHRDGPLGYVLTGP